MKVVETPLERCLLTSVPGVPVRDAIVQLTVEPGCSAVISGSNTPWYLGHADEELEYAALQSRVAGELQAKERMVTSDDRCGIYEDRNGDRILAVKVSHKCSCDEKNWVEKTVAEPGSSSISL